MCRPRLIFFKFSKPTSHASLRTTHMAYSPFQLAVLPVATTLRRRGLASGSLLADFPVPCRASQKGSPKPKPTVLHSESHSPKSTSLKGGRLARSAVGCDRAEHLHHLALCAHHSVATAAHLLHVGEALGRPQSPVEGQSFRSRPTLLQLSHHAAGHMSHIL